MKRGELVEKIVLLFEANGQSIQITNVSLESKTLGFHSNNRPTLQLLQNENWDHVILQEQSILPLIDKLRNSSMIPALKKLTSRNGPKYFLAATWPRGKGGKDCIENRCTKTYANARQMHQDLQVSFERIHESTGLELIHLGKAWMELTNYIPASRLWQPDNSHPTDFAQKVNATIIFKSLSGEWPALLPWEEMAPIMAYLK